MGWWDSITNEVGKVTRPVVHVVDQGEKFVEHKIVNPVIHDVKDVTGTVYNDAKSVVKEISKIPKEVHDIAKDDVKDVGKGVKDMMPDMDKLLLVVGILGGLYLYNQQKR